MLLDLSANKRFFVCLFGFFGARVRGIPARLGDDHLRANIMEALPQVRALQLHLDLLHGGRRRWFTGSGGQVVWRPEGAGRPFGEPLSIRAGTRLRVWKRKRLE